MAKRDRFFDIKKHVNCANPVIIDGGAHKGETISIFKPIFNDAMIFAFEPIPELALKLKKKYTTDSNVNTIPKILGRTNKIVTFNVLQFTATSSVLNPSK